MSSSIRMVTCQREGGSISSKEIDHVVRFLAGDIGSRPAGSSAENETAEFIAKLFKDRELTTVNQTFRFRHWEGDGSARLRVTAGSDKPRELDAVSLPYTFPTPQEGLTGSLVWDGVWPIIRHRLECPKYSVMSPGGEPVAQVLVCPVGEARPLPNTAPLMSIPTVVVDREDGEQLLSLVSSTRAAIDVHLFSERSVESLRPSRNLVLHVGENARRIVVGAHYDSVPGSPGANDNASGVAVLVRLAERIAHHQASMGSSLGITFAFFGAEEPFLLGSREFVSRFAAEGILSQVEAFLNLDMVAVGEHFSVRRVDDSFWANVLRNMPDQSVTGTPILETDLYPSSDHWAFHEAGIASAQLTREPDPAWHSSNDSIDRFTVDKVDDAASVAFAIIERATRRLAQGK